MDGVRSCSCSGAVGPRRGGWRRSAGRSRSRVGRTRPGRRPTSGGDEVVSFFVDLGSAGRIEPPRRRFVGPETCRRRARIRPPRGRGDAEGVPPGRIPARSAGVVDVLGAVDAPDRGPRGLGKGGTPKVVPPTASRAPRRHPRGFRHRSRQPASRGAAGCGIGGALARPLRVGLTCSRAPAIGWGSFGGGRRARRRSGDTG